MKSASETGPGLGGTGLERAGGIGTTVLLLRHAEPVHPSVWGNDEYTRPLTESGQRAAAALAQELRARAIDAIYSSPYLRALQTVAPLAAARGLRVELVQDLREHQLSPEPIAHWREALEASWRDLDAAPGGAETLAFTRRRGLRALEQLRLAHPEGTIAIGGHGTLFACILQAFRPSVDCAFHLAMPMPAVYELEHGTAGWRILSGPGIENG